MIRNRILLKTIAVFLILETLANTVAPTITWALTAGPTAPEATSFEPVDTTDMVNAITGDFTYNLPLMEVPGPGGSYPVTLAYHSEIKPNVDASWVGLGWSLNPGAINRMVNGLPDDFNGANTVRRDFWEGGEMTQESYGVSVGIGNVVTVSGGVIIANDTYKGRGVGSYMGLGVGVVIGKAKASVDVTAVISPYGGDVSTSLGVGVGIGKSIGALEASAGIGLTVNLDGKVSAGLGGGVSAGHQRKDAEGNAVGSAMSGSLVGASISSEDGSASLGVAGGRLMGNNSGAGKISSRTKGWAFDIPVYYGINVSLSRQYTRYWMDQTENLLNYGSLHFPTENIGDMSTKVYDTYHVQGAESLALGENASRQPNGTFADYDQYNVNAQGLGGSFRPHHYLLSVASQDIIVTEGEDEVQDVLGYYIPQHAGAEVLKYSFINDFSGKVIHDPADIDVNRRLQNYPDSEDEDYTLWKQRMEDTYSADLIPLIFPYTSPVVGMEGRDEVPGQKRDLKRVAGSKHIEYFTNQDILNNPNEARSNGFIECNVAGFDRSGLENNAGDGVGGFAITNTSGVTYNFSLPAYSYDEYTYSQNKDEQSNIAFNNVEQRGKYAYTWFLTSVTGPDYVDRGPSGTADNILNEYDWGYWVEFQYGKWTDKYQWRNPAEGFNEDLDSRFQSFSKGKKELYYLDAIKTATHTAFFVKEIRADGKGVTSQKDESVLTDKQAKTVTYTDHGGFSFQKDSKTLPFLGAPPVTLQSDFQKVSFPTSSLRLKKILLLENKGIENLNLASSSSTYSHTYNYQVIDPAIVEAHKQYVASSPLHIPPSTNWLNQNFPGPKIINLGYKLHLGENVIDVHDLQNNPISSDKILREIDFDFDYSLAPGTSNSFDETGSLYTCETCNSFVPDDGIINTKSGKLTLNSVVFKGKGGNSSLPPLNFKYDDPDPLLTDAELTAIDEAKKIIDVSIFTIGNKFAVGDIVKIRQGENTFHGYITQNGAAAKVKIISSVLPALGYISKFTRTKNPPYHKDLYDMWGLYKVDYFNDQNSNLTRYPTPVSASNTDVWSLREIETSLGSKIEINYESDTYNQSVLSKNLSVPLNLVDVEARDETLPPEEYFKVILEAKLLEESPLDFISLGYSVGGPASLVAAFYTCTQEGAGLLCGPNIQTACTVIEVAPKVLRLRVFVPADEYQGFFGANMNLMPRDIQYGGGIRVGSIGIYDPLKLQTRYTRYGYEFNGKSSGVTSYEPITVGNANLNTIHENLNRLYASYMLAPFIDMLSLSRDVPAPGIYYGKVKVEETIIDNIGTETKIPGYSMYEFETFNKGMIAFVNGSNADGQGIEADGTHRGQPYGNTQRLKKVLKNFTQRLGSLKSVTLFDDNGNKVNETINHYLHDEQTGQTFDHNSGQYKQLLGRFKQQGVVEETFYNGRWVRNNIVSPFPQENRLVGLISKRETYPVVHTGTTVINYKSGISTKTSFLEFDFNSGQTKKTLSTDSYGNKYISEVLPAYLQYPDMGLQIDGGKNMLAQQAGSYSYKVDNANAPTGLVSASIQTWSKSIPILAKSDENVLANPEQYNVWKNESTYSWKGDDQTLNSDGLYPYSSFVDFFDNPNWPQWQKNSQIRLYDIYSHALEASDVNENYAATKMSYDQTKVFATVANGQYDEFAFSGAEEQPSALGVYGGNVMKINGGEVTKQSAEDNFTTHTGRKALRLTSSDQKTLQYSFTTIPGRSYHASVWVNSNSGRLFYSVNGVTQTPAVPSESKKAGSWYLVSLDIPSASVSSTVEVWSATAGTACNFDDFRVCPSDAAMTSYVYNEWGELSHTLNNNNLYTEYRYDALGRLQETFQERFNKDEAGLNVGRYKMSDVRYHYANQD